MNRALLRFVCGIPASIEKLVVYMDFTLADIMIRLVLGLAVGFCIGSTGIGGGVLVLPSLVILLGMPPTVCVGTASLFSFIAKLYGAFRHARHKNVDWSMSLLVLGGAVPANLAASWLINGEAESTGELQAGLAYLMATVILVMAVLMVIDLTSRFRRQAADEPGRYAVKLAAAPCSRRAVALVFGVLVGGLLGATSLGGGVIIISGVILIFGLPARRAVGSSLFIGVVLTFLTSAVYWFHGQIDYLTAVIMAAGSLAGVHAGSVMSEKLPDRVLRTAIVAIVVVAAVLMFVR